ncbi:MAG: hypothetical protein U0768_12175 [Anaerolineae bacterium]
MRNAPPSRTIVCALLVLFAALLLGWPAVARAQGPTPPSAPTPAPIPTPAFPKVPDSNLQFLVDLWPWLTSYVGGMVAVVLLIFALFLLLWLTGMLKKLQEWLTNTTTKTVGGWVSPPPDLSDDERNYLEQAVSKGYRYLELRALDEREAGTQIPLREIYIPLRGRGGPASDASREAWQAAAWVTRPETHAAKRRC